MHTISRSARPGSEDGRESADKRLDDLALGLFLLLTGALWLMPYEGVPAGSWLVGTGVILLGLNAVRYFTARTVSVFTLVLGVLAFTAGIAEMSGANLPIIALALLAIGATLLLRVGLSSRDNR
jgi:hypothetical protein